MKIIERICVKVEELRSEAQNKGIEECGEELIEILKFLEIFRVRVKDIEEIKIFKKVQREYLKLK